MNSAAGDVKARAGAMMQAWRKRNVAAFDGELQRAAGTSLNGTKSSFEAEREELLDCIALQMQGAAQRMSEEQPECVAEIDTCLGLLEHLATR